MTKSTEYEYDAISLADHRMKNGTNRKLGENTAPDVGGRTHHVKLTESLEGYRRNGFWYYRNSNPNAAPFARMTCRVTDVRFQERLDILFERTETDGCSVNKGWLLKVTRE